MDRPAAKSFLDRVFKPPAAAASAKSFLASVVSAKETQAAPEPAAQKPTACGGTFNRLVDFKETLRQRMKAKRQQIRAEEEEDDLIDEEYHVSKEKAADTAGDDEASKDSKSDGDDEDEDGDEEDEEGSEADEEDFKLNLNDDDDEPDEKDKKKKKDAYDFSDEDDEPPSRSEANKKSEKTNKMSLIEIPSTNSIPSNQLTKNSGLKNRRMNSEFEALENDDTTQDSRLYGAGGGGGGENNRRSIDEMTNISFNYESNQNNTTDSTLNSLSLAHNSLNQSEKNEEVGGEDEEVLFDELAMLCSGQFKATNTSKKLTIEKMSHEDEDKTTNTSLTKVTLDNPDLYDATSDDGESKSRPTLKEGGESTGAAKTDEDDTDADADDDSDVEPVVVEKEKARNRVVIDDDEDANDAHEEEAEEEDEEEEIEGSAEGEGEPIRKEDFFEKEAELSGSDAGSDEDDDGGSDMGSMLFSGDEDELPSDSELKEQLGKIYLKDQLDQDKKELRMFKEMYLADGELHSEKGQRRKQFLWKNLNDGAMLNRFSSDEEDDDDEDDEDEEGGEGDEEKIKDKSKRFAKSLAKRNWRSVRHEREEFVKKSINADNLLSDDEGEGNENSNSSSSFKAGAAAMGNQLLKKGQQLLKQQTVTAPKQQKRTLDGQVATALADSSPNRPTKSSISIEKIGAKKPQTSGSGSENLLSKYSFLSRDKGYLSRISSYVNKNFYGGASAEGASSSRYANRTNSNMVFASIDVETGVGGEEAPAPGITLSSAGLNKFAKKSYLPPSSAKVLDESAEAASAPKRTRYEDTCESIFNHIN